MKHTLKRVIKAAVENRPVNNSYRSRVQCLTMDLRQYVDEATATALQRLLPNVIFDPIVKPIASSKASSVSIELPLPAIAADALRTLVCRRQDYFLWNKPSACTHPDVLGKKAVHPSAAPR
jgi:hypothetical protein